MRKGFAVDESFFDTWSSEMSYVLGYIFADGSLENSIKNRGKYVRVSSIDYESIDRIKKVLKSKHKIIKEKAKKSSHKDRYILRIGNTHLFESIKKRGICERKSLTMEFPHVPKKYLSDFVRGYFDGDGCVFLYMAKNSKGEKIIKKLSIIFTCGSRIFLECLTNELYNRLSLKQNKIYNSHRSFQLRYTTEDSLKIFNFLYKNPEKNLFLNRKFVIFGEYFRIKSLPPKDR